MAFGKSATKAAQKSDGAPAPDETTLQGVRKEIGRARDLQLEIADLNEQVARKQEQLNKILLKSMPGTFGDLGIDFLGLEAEGNLPAYDAQLKTHYHAVLPKDPELRRQGIAWLEKHKHGDVVKTVIVTALGLGERKKAKLVIAALRKLKVEYTGNTDVPWGTLTALVRELIEKRGVTPPMDILGATMIPTVTLKPRKEKEKKVARGGSDD